jgi:hypothetical protein
MVNFRVRLKPAGCPARWQTEGGLPRPARWNWSTALKLAWQSLSELSMAPCLSFDLLDVDLPSTSEVMV